MGEQLNLRRFRGDTWVFDIAFDDGRGNPIDITGNVLSITLKNHPGDVDGDAALQHSVTFPDDEASSRGEGQMMIPSNKTGIPPGTYRYDIQKVIPPDDPDDPPIVTTLMYGSFTVVGDITLGTSAP